MEARRARARHHRRDHAPKTPEAAETLASLLTHYLIHYGYPGRKATAGNIAYPLSPNLVSFRREDGSSAPSCRSGTRDPVFFANYEKVKAAVIGLIEAQFPDALAQAEYRIIDADAAHPGVLLRTIDDDPERLAARHAAEIEAITKLAPAKPGSRLNLDAADAYEWSLYHLLQNEEVIKQQMFPITLLPRRRRRLGEGRQRTRRATSTSASRATKATSTTARCR